MSGIANALIVATRFTIGERINSIEQSRIYQRLVWLELYDVLILLMR